ncbi:MAG: mannitol dehydrogenase family protein [Clostridiaceae bacterium]|nr:mannitol dehydrogenase family protein [Clostridiaceae bacterium]
MKLSLESITAGQWKATDVRLPQWDMAAMRERTRRHPLWLHFGAGNIFRALIACQQQDLIDEGHCERGIIVAETFDPEIIEKIYKPHDDLSVAVFMHPDGQLDKRLVASVAESVETVTDPAGFLRVKEIFEEPGLQLVSFTITEKGYALKGISGDWLPAIARDMEEGPQSPQGVIAIATAGLYSRFINDAGPLALVSLDNCSKNGEKLGEAVTTMARAWHDGGFVSAAFLDYLEDPARISFPWSMIDKITPQPDASVQGRLSSMGIEGMKSIRTSKNTFIAPFVNAEVPEYLVIEDSFPNGRPPLEKAGTLFTDRHSVEQAEKMKVTTCLNPLHTALAIMGCLLGYTSIADEMANPLLRELVERIGYDEGLPVVPESKILDPRRFIKEVIEQRLPNPFIPDTPQRIAIDTSQKIVVRFGETIKSYVKRPDLDPASLNFIPLVIAVWFRYLLGLDDQLQVMEIASDPLAPELSDKLQGISPNDPSSYQGELIPLLKNETLFGSDLTEIGLAEKIENYFIDMLRGPGSIETLLEKLIARAREEK